MVKLVALKLLARVAAFLQRTRRRRKANEALRASEEHYRVLFEQTADGIVLADATGGFKASCVTSPSGGRQKRRFGLVKSEPVRSWSRSPTASSFLTTTGASPTSMRQANASWTAPPAT